jgi:hypothetical protein
MLTFLTRYTNIFITYILKISRYVTEELIKIQKSYCVRVLAFTKAVIALRKTAMDQTVLFEPGH